MHPTQKAVIYYVEVLIPRTYYSTYVSVFCGIHGFFGLFHEEGWNADCIHGNRAFQIGRRFMLEV